MACSSSSAPPRRGLAAGTRPGACASPLRRPASLRRQCRTARRSFCAASASRRRAAPVRPRHGSASPDRIVGEHLRVGRDGLQRCACALDVACCRGRVRQQAQQLAAALAKVPVRLLERVLEPRCASAGRPVIRCRRASPGCGSQPSAWACLNEASRLRSRRGSAGHRRARSRRRPRHRVRLREQSGSGADLGGRTFELAARAEHRGVMQPAGAGKGRHVARTAPLEVGVRELRGTQPVATEARHVQDRTKGPAGHPGAHAPTRITAAASSCAASPPATSPCAISAWPRYARPRHSTSGSCRLRPSWQASSAICMASAEVAIAQRHAARHPGVVAALDDSRLASR